MSTTGERRVKEARVPLESLKTTGTDPFITSEELSKHIDRLIKYGESILETPYPSSNAMGYLAETSELARRYAGERSQFFLSLKGVNSIHGKDAIRQIISLLRAFKSHLSAGLADALSPEQKAQMDVVSDFLGMAQTLLETKEIHPAAPAVIIGASLEEYLRNWIERENLSLGNRKPGIDNYCQVLREADFITKQDAKDITSWAGVRNHAAHGEWDQVNDPKRISLMLEGVNLFMRKNSP